MHDVVINKIATIKRCLARVHQEYTDEESFKGNYTKQDSVILNIQRACEAAIDVANHLIKENQLGIPQSARDSFELIAKGQIITIDTAQKLKKMIGLRNIAVRDYQPLNLDILIVVINNHLTDFDHFCARLIAYVEAQGSAY